MLFVARSFVDNGGAFLPCRDYLLRVDVPRRAPLVFLIVGFFAFLELFKELGRNEGLLDCADRWLAGKRISRMKSVCVCAIVTPYFARRFIPNLLASYREWSNRRMNEMVDGLILTLKGFEEKEH